MDKTERTKAWVVYAGPRADAGNELRYVYYRLPSLDLNNGSTIVEDLELHQYDRSLFKRGAIGCIYPAEFEGESRIVYKTNEPFVAVWKIDRDTVKWRAFETAAKKVKELKSEASKNTMIESLQPIREAYQQSTTEGRRALLAEVLRVITHPRPWKSD